MLIELLRSFFDLVDKFLFDLHVKIVDVEVHVSLEELPQLLSGRNDILVDTQKGWDSFVLDVDHIFCVQTLQKKSKSLLSVFWQIMLEVVNVFCLLKMTELLVILIVNAIGSVDAAVLHFDCVVYLLNIKCVLK